VPEDERDKTHTKPNGTGDQPQGNTTQHIDDDVGASRIHDPCLTVKEAAAEGKQKE